MDHVLTPQPQAGDRARALVTVTSAFAGDPVERWLYPEDDQCPQHFPEFAAALGGDAFNHETAWGTTDGAAIALWLPPGAGTDEATPVEILTATVSPAQHDEMYGYWNGCRGTVSRDWAANRGDSRRRRLRHGPQRKRANDRQARRVGYARRVGCACLPDPAEVDRGLC